MSFLGLEGYHVFITGAAGGIGSEAVREFLRQGCNVTAHDLKPIPSPEPPNPHFYSVTGDISSESSISSSIQSAVSHFGPINILVCNAGITDESASYNIWEIPLEIWEKTYNTNVRGTFLTIKHFLRSASEAQAASNGTALENLAIVLTGSETGKFGQAGHTEYASGKAGLQYGLVRGVKNELVKLNSKARINAVAPGWVNTPMIEGRLDDRMENWIEAEATVPLRKIAQPEDVARAMVFLASHRAAGHITGECLSVDGGMEGRIVWRPEETGNENISPVAPAIPQSIVPSPRRPIRILLSVDFDAVSGLLGTGAASNHTLADYSSGYFAAQVGVPRLLKLFGRHEIASKVTWFIPGHSMESFPAETNAILDSGAEIGCHGYAHKGSMQMTEAQEGEMIEKCIQLATELTGKAPRGWRAPLYQLREHTIKVLEEKGFLYDSSLTHHDSTPYFLPSNTAVPQIDFSPSKSAETWMHPISPAAAPTPKTLVEIPCNWYMEDMTPMQFLPQVPNSHGFVSPSVVEQNWKARFEFLEREAHESDTDIIFPLVLHPDTSGMAHVIGMVERMIVWLKGKGNAVEFVRYGDYAADWRARQT